MDAFTFRDSSKDASLDTYSRALSQPPLERVIRDVTFIPVFALGIVYFYLIKYKHRCYIKAAMFVHC